MDKPSRHKSRDRLLHLPLGFHVLLALEEGPAHGAEIARRVLEHSMGRYVGGTSLYDEIRRLERSGLVERGWPGWRSELRITAEGERVLRLAARETKRVVNVARQAKLC
jgi:DNA-binding PadR family transcriptional regulator